MEVGRWDGWAYQFGVQLDFIRPGKPVENSYIESFNGRLRDECLNVEVFFALAYVRDKLERWRQDYNQVRPHSALRDNAPALFAAQWAETATPGPEPVPASVGKARNGQITGDTQLSLLSAKNAGHTGLNWITQPVFSTLTWYAFAGQVRLGRTLPLNCWADGGTLRSLCSRRTQLIELSQCIAT